MGDFWSPGGSRQSTGYLARGESSPSSKKKTSASKTSDLINTIGGNLSGMKAYDQVNPYSNTQGIYSALANEVERSIMRPQYERFSYNPFQRSFANQAAGSGLGMAGNKQRVYSDQLRSQVEMPYETQRDAMRTTFEGLARDAYSQGIQDNYNDSTAFTKYNAFKL